MNRFLIIFFSLICFYSYSQKETSGKINFFISPLIYQFENTDDWINTINSDYVSLNTYRMVSSEIGLNYIYQSNKVKIGGGISLKNYTMKFDVNFSEFDISNRNVNLFNSKQRVLKRNSLGLLGIIGYQFTKSTNINFILNYYNHFYVRNNTISGIDGEIGVTNINGFDAIYKEHTSLFRSPNFIPEINITTKLIDGFYLNYGIKSKIRKKNYFSASITGKTSSSSNQEILLDMNAYSRHTAFYVGIGYRFDVRKPIKNDKLD